MRRLSGVILKDEEIEGGHFGRWRWAEGPQPAKRACLPQGLEEGARSAPQLLVLPNGESTEYLALRLSSINDCEKCKTHTVL